MTRRRLQLLLITALLAFGAPTGAFADDEHGRAGDNAAVAVNTVDDSSRFRFAYSLDRESGDVVDNQNAAVAFASCERCRTTAIAVQIVLVSSSPSTVVPQNLALALNESCTSCQTFATAFQFVVGVEDASVRFTDAGKRELKRILGEFRALRHDTYTLEEFHTRTQALGDELRAVLKTLETGDDPDPVVEVEEDTETRSG